MSAINDTELLAQAAARMIATLPPCYWRARGARIMRESTRVRGEARVALQRALIQCARQASISETAREVLHSG